MDFTEQEIAKAFSIADEVLMRKGRGLPVGTVRNWKGQEYIKTAKGKWIPNKKQRTGISKEDQEYFAAIKKGDTEKIQKMVMQKAKENGFTDCIPEQAEGYKLRISAPPKKTKTIYKTFYVDTNGKPSALFVGNSENLPMNVWLDAKDSYHFTDPKNGKEYVPSMSNPNNTKSHKTGDVHRFDAETKKELIKRGFITERANSVIALAYRPGWHGGDLPFFPQGGKKVKNSNYDNIHRWNQVVFEIEVDADTDYTPEAKKNYERKKANGDRKPQADLQHMPEHGFYQFTTNPTVKEQTGGKGDWFISHSMKIKRALTEEECNKILAENGLKPQEWEDKETGEIGKLDLSKLGYTGPDYDAARKTLAPITYDDNGKIIPLSERFNKNSTDVRKSLTGGNIMQKSEDPKFKHFQKLILKHLSELEKKEGDNLDDEDIAKAITVADIMVMRKGGKGYPVGTIREWKGKKYIKIAPNKWKPKYDSNTRGAKMAIAAIKRKASQCTNSQELMSLILENRDRFSDENGRPLPFVQELSSYISEINDKMESSEDKETTKEPEETPKSAKDKFRELMNNFPEEERKKKLEIAKKRGGERGKFAEEMLAEMEGDKKEPETENSTNNDGFTLDDIRHIGDGKHSEDTKLVKDLDVAKDVVRQIAEKYGATDKGGEQLYDFIALNIGGGSPLFDKIYEAYGISYEDRDNDLEEAFKLMLKTELGKDTKKERENIDSSNQDFDDRVRQMYEDEEKGFTEEKKKDSGKNEFERRADEVNKLVSDAIKKYTGSPEVEKEAKKLISRKGEKRLREITCFDYGDDKEHFKKFVEGRLEEDRIRINPWKDNVYTDHVFERLVERRAQEMAKEKLQEMEKTDTKSENIPLEPKDMEEAKKIIGKTVDQILDGKDIYGNGKQGLTDKIKRRVRNEPGVARAMLMLIKDRQEKTGKEVYTPRHSIWKLLPLLNENAKEAQKNNESETKTGVSGVLYKGDDGTTVVENKDWGRYQIDFPGKPDGETISLLKRNGFRWSPKTKTWVCYNTANGEYGLKRVVKELGLKNNEETKKSMGDNMSAYDEFMELAKAFGKKDLSKLHKEKVTDKLGISRTVWKKNNQKEDSKRQKKGEVETGDKNGTTSNSNYTVGEEITGTHQGEEVKGKIVSQADKGVTIVTENNTSYKIPYGNIKEKTKNADGTIPADKFNANDYKEKATDPKAKKNDDETASYIYGLLGEEGKETAKVTKRKLDELDNILAEKGDTQKRYKTVLKGYNEDGKPIYGYTKERSELHKQILKKVLSSENVKKYTPEDGKQPTFVMFGGRGGSGKSWFTNKERAQKEGREVMFDKDKFLVLDADEIKESIPEYKNWNAGEVHEESSDIMKDILSKAKDLGLNIIIDGTMNFKKSNPDKVKNQMMDFKNAGYRIEAHYMFLPVQESAKRAIMRFRTKKGDYSGRLVPMNILLSMQDNEKSFDSVKDIVDDWSFRDNQGTDGPKLISKKE